MRFGVLGPLTVWPSTGPAVRVPGRKVRALLADLLIHAPRPISADRLIDDIWAGDPPAKATAALQAKVSQLRLILERCEPDSRGLLVFRRPSYVLEVEPAAIDAGVFTALTTRAQATDDSRVKATLLADALALWRGPALIDVADEGFAQAAVTRLEDERLVALEDQAEARLALGQHGVLVVELTELVAEHPLRERLRAAQMRALHRSGRQSEAVKSYGALRHRLVEDQGLNPSPELDALHVAILNHDPALDPDAAVPSAPSAALGTNLPRPLGRLVGRADAVTELRPRLASERLVTLTGPGGVGKSCLALAAANATVDSFPDGAWLVELAPLARPGNRHVLESVAEAVMATLGIRDETTSRSPVTDRLAAALSTRHALLVLDNCEPVIDAVAGLVDVLLRASPGLHVLATSQLPLGLAGERVWSVPPLDAPSAVELFVERATAAAPGFVLDDANSSTVASICRRLDGIPLALELAATRVRALGVDQVAARLDDRFRLLSSGYRSAPARQQTLRATIDWSWDLLTEPDRALLGCLAVHETWTFDAVDDIDGLARLVDRSLVTMIDQTDGPRYRMLESVAAYAIERLFERGELTAVEEQHGLYYATLAERADAGLRGRDQRRWLQRLDHDSANLRRALDAACRRDDAALALRLVNATAWYLFLRGRLGEARRRVEQALAVDDGDSPAATARATAWRDGLRLLMGDPADPPTPPPRFDDIDDLAQRARAEWFLGFAKSDWGQITTSEALVAQALASCEDHGDVWGRAAALSTRAKQAYIRGDLAAVAPDGEQSLALFRQLGDRWGQLQAMEWLGALAKLAGDYERDSAPPRRTAHRPGARTVAPGRRPDVVAGPDQVATRRSRRSPSPPRAGPTTGRRAQLQARRDLRRDRPRLRRPPSRRPRRRRERPHQRRHRTRPIQSPDRDDRRHRPDRTRLHRRATRRRHRRPPPPR
jgi:predicted ATPase/DNA-binding SARP family transcriptional activator